MPYLVRDDGVGLEDSSLICAYLDHLDGEPAFDPPDGGQAWEVLRLEAQARSLLDRSARLADVWEREIDHPLMRGELNLPQVALACALGLEARNPQLRWRPGHPGLADWFDRIAARPSLATTAPPG